MDDIVFRVVELPAGGFEAESLTYPIELEADTLDELREVVLDALWCYFDDDERPRTVRFLLVQGEARSA